MTHPLTNLFRSSPFFVIREHIHIVTECVHELIPLFDAVLQQDGERFNTTKTRINQLEKQADQLKDDLRAHLPRSLFMPVDRSVFLEVLDFQDSLADVTQEIAGLLAQKTGLTFPEGQADALRAFIQSTVATCNQTEKVIHELGDLVEAGFRGRQAERVRDMIAELNLLESAADQQGDAMARLIFESEETLGPVGVMVWYRVIRWVGKIADRAEAAGNRLNLMTAK
jgi:hypothetical protein